MLRNKHQGVYIEDLLEIQRRFKEGDQEPYMLPKIPNRVSTSVSFKHKISGLSNFGNYHQPNPHSFSGRQGVSLEPVTTQEYDQILNMQMQQQYGDNFRKA